MNVGGNAFSKGINFASSNYNVKFTIDKNNNVIISEHKKKTMGYTSRRLRKIPLLKGLVSLLSNRLMFVLIIVSAALDMGMFFTEDVRNDDIDLMIIVILGVIFLIYIIFILKNICFNLKNILQYHAAEHKTIYAYENNIEMTMENIRKCPRTAKRCGTNLCVFLIIFAVPTSLLIPFASLSVIVSFMLAYELFDLNKGDKYPLLKIFFKFGYFCQEKFLTKEPTDIQINASIIAFKKLIELNKKSGL